MSYVNINPQHLAKRIRLHCLKMIHRGNGSHIGSCLSVVDIISVLYSRILNVNPADPRMPNRDRFILSKGHAGATVYAALAEIGFFSLEKLNSYYQDGSTLSGHMSHAGVPGVEISTGSLGHGLSIGAGFAYAGKLKKSTYKVYVLLSDGECDEGSNWEAILFSAHHKLDNLYAIIDYNKIQSLGLVSETLGLEPLRLKWESFGWEVVEVDGHSMENLENGFLDTCNLNDKPKCIIAHTTKGKGISFMENSVLWHYRSPNNSEYEAAIRELEDSK